MKIIQGRYPPNIESIRSVVGEQEGTIYCFGDTVFNPSGKEIPEDILFHESIHVRQQKVYTTPDLWWQRYLLDVDFRLDQEAQAYAEQANVVKKLAPKVLKEALKEFGTNLSTIYKLGITEAQAETIIRHRMKEL